MSKKRIVISGLIIILGIAAGLYWIFIAKNGYFKTRGKAFAIQDTSRIERVSIISQGDTVSIARGSNKQWNVNKHVADQHLVALFLDNLTSMETGAPVSVKKASSYSDLIKSKGKKVIISSHKKVLKMYHVLEGAKGSPSMLLMEGRNTPYFVSIPGLRIPVAGLFKTDVGFWRDNTIFSFLPGEISFLKVEYPAKNGFIIQKKNGKYMVKHMDGSGIDTSINQAVVEDYLVYYSNIVYEKIARDYAMLADSMQVASIYIRDKGSNSYQLDIYKKFSREGQQLKEDLYYYMGVVDQDRNEPVEVRFMLIAPLLQEVQYFFRP